MSDQPASPNPSYVDSYAPPQNQSAADPVSPSPSPSPAPVQPVEPAAPAPAPAPVQPVMPARPATPTPPANPAPQAPEPVQAMPKPSSDSEALEDQNIFYLLGVDDATEAEKESFLDELQQVIWEDFLENDVELLLTEAEMTELKTMMEGKNSNDLEQQEKIVTFLEKLVPDLEEIMLEKALELKADMVKERIASMREYFATQTDKLATVSKAESLVNEDQWRAAAEVLNSLT